MASGETTGTVQCPHCKEPLLFPVSMRHISRTEAALSIDLDPVREHMASHEPRWTMELPPTAR